MMVSLSRLLLVMAALQFLVFGVSAQPDTGAQGIERQLNGGWVVAYRDTKLGLISGRAYIDTSINLGTLTFRLPDGRVSKLSADSFSVDGNVVRILWTTVSTGEEARFEPFGERLNAPLGGVKLKIGDAVHKISLGVPRAPDGTITSELVYHPESKSFSGNWGQYVDAVTGDSGGEVRNGTFAYGEHSVGGGTLTGGEYWTRPKPVIKDAFVIRPQFAMGLYGPGYPDPFGTVTDGSPSDKIRYVFIYGKNLPQSRGERIDIVSEDQDVSYYLYALKATYDREDVVVDKELLNEALGRVDLKAGVANPPYRKEVDDDFLILEVTLQSGVTPGYKALSINGVDTAWTLRFGDHRAELGFARDLTLGLAPELRENATSDVELTDIVYAPEEIFVELHTQVEMPFDNFQILLSHNDEFVKFGEKRGVTAHKQTAIGSPKVYRSDPFQIASPGTADQYPPGTQLIEAKPGDKLHATLGGARVLNVSNPIATVKIIGTPADLLKAIEGEAAPKGMLWQQAVLEAAKCAGIDEADSIPIGQVSRKEADNFTDTVISTLWRDVETLLNTRINVGEHAGTIMMRPVFISMLKAAEETYSAPMSDSAIIGLRLTLSVAVTDGGHPLSYIKVAAPSGDEIPLAMTFYDNHLEDQYGLKGEQLVEYQVKAMRVARAKLLTQIRGSIRKLKDIDPCDVKEMLYLTGFGTEDVQRRTYAGLMKPRTYNDNFLNEAGTQVQSVRQIWVADRQARARVANVSLYAKTLKAQEKLSDDEWDNFAITVSVISIPIGAVGGGVLALESVVQAAAFIDISDFFINVIQEGSKQYSEHQELNFATGASAVIGDRRLRQAIRDDSPFLLSLWKTIASGMQAGAAVRSLGSAADLERAIIRANRSTKSIMASDGSKLEAFKALKPERQRDIYRAIIAAMDNELKLGRGLLETRELEMLEFERLIANEDLVRAAFGPVRPEWARRLGNEAWLRLDDMVTRPDLQRLIRESPTEMERFLLDDDAINFLRLPQTDLANLQRAVTRYKNRAPSRGPAFVEQAAESRGNPEGLFLKTIVNEGDEGPVAYTNVFAGQSAGGTRYGEFVRGRRPDMVFDTGKDLFVFDMALANRMDLPDELLATPGKFVPGSPQLDLTELRQAGAWRRRAGPRWVPDVEIPLRDGDPGVPFVMFNNLRSFNSLGFRYADPSLGGIMLKQVASANTCGQLAWLRHTYPSKSVDDLFRYTLSYRYAENTAQQLGFRISEVRVVGAVPGQPDYTGAYATLDQMANGRWFDPGGAKTLQEAEAAKRAFLELYTLPGNPSVPQSFNVYLKFEPL